MADPASAVSPQVRLLLDLTDEELMALDGLEQGIVMLPYLDVIDTEHLEQVRATALRSLAARGLVRFLGPSAAVASADDGQPLPGRPIAIEPDIALLLAARRSPDAVMAVQRWRGGPQRPETLMRYVHQCQEELVVEDVSPSGIHRFALAEMALLPTLMGDFLAVAEPHGPPAAVPAPPQARPGEYVPGRDGLDLLADVHLVAEIVVRWDSAPVTTSRAAYVFPDVAYVGTAPLDDPKAVVLRPVPLAELGGWAAESLVGVGAPMGQSTA